MAIYGYMRVSTREQNEQRQRDALAAYGIPPKNLYIDKQSGKDFVRPAYKRLLWRIREGDLLVVKSIDRLGRNYRDVMEQWRVITKEKGADIKVLDMPLLDTTQAKDLLGTFIADMVLQLLSFVAENERDAIRQRQAEGIASAKARGVKFGRPARPLPENFEKICERWLRGGISLQDAAYAAGMPRSTFYRKMREQKKAGSADAASNSF
ncbi:recombinase family protein [Christensenella intestinihominis]|uniref:recombinase family protein n=1 Tax=Christensenella intestinihominis TaxID=1851429 RepID=UPI0008378E4C|nr:recombinase family protein [Christensenella intestinihominis]